MGSAAAEVLEQSGYTMDDIDYVVCHQANERIIDAVVKRMDIPEERLLRLLQDMAIRQQHQFLLHWTRCTSRECLKKEIEFYWLRLEQVLPGQV